MEDQIKAIAEEFGINQNDTDAMQEKYNAGNFAGSFKQKVDTMMQNSGVEFCPFYEFLKG